MHGSWQILLPWSISLPCEANYCMSFEKLFICLPMSPFNSFKRAGGLCHNAVKLLLFKRFPAHWRRKWTFCVWDVLLFNALKFVTLVNRFLTVIVRYVFVSTIGPVYLKKTVWSKRPTRFHIFQCASFITFLMRYRSWSSFLRSEVENLTMLVIFQWSVAALITNVGVGPLLNDRGGAAAAARAHHLIERAPDGPISGVNGRPRAALLLVRVISSRTRCHCFFVMPVNCYDFLWPRECVES